MDFGSTTPFEVLNQPKEPLAFFAKITKAPQGGTKGYLILIKLPLSRSILSLKNP
jgi:hypothetical protein